MKEILMNKNLKTRKAYVHPSLDRFPIEEAIGFICVSGGMGARGEEGEVDQLGKDKEWCYNANDDDDFFCYNLDFLFE